MSIKITKNVSLAPYTTFRIGGPADYFCEVKKLDELREALDFAKKNNLEVFIFGGGSNLLVSDNGFNGLVVRIQNSEFRIQNSIIEVEAGVPLGKIIVESVNHGLAGLEWAAGIPGTVGGAIRGNAGAFGGSMQDVVEEVQALDMENGNMYKISKKDCFFAYRESIFKKNSNLVIWSVKLSLKEADKNALKNFIQEKAKYRIEHHPLDLPSAGSIFKNIHDVKVIKDFCKKFPDMEDNVKKWGNKIPAAYLIDRCGLKEKRIGGAMISPKHPNFIVNFNQASAEDAVILMSVVKQKVRNKFGILLEEEVQLAGFGF